MKDLKEFSPFWRVAGIIGLMMIFIAVTAVAWAGMPYKWPKDTGGDIENEGDDANGWHYYVDYYFPEEHFLERMIYCDACGRWEDPLNGHVEGQNGLITKEGKRWKVIAGVWDLGGGDEAAVNPKVALHPNIDEDLGSRDIRHGRASINMHALPGGCSLRVFIVPSDGYGNPDVNSPDKIQLAGPVNYGPNQPIQGSWPVSIGTEDSGADMTHCHWIVFEFDDPRAGNPGDQGGGGNGEGDDDDDDDDVVDDDDDTDDDDDIVEFEEDFCPLLAEIVATPSGSQFIEIANYGDKTIFLHDVYLSNSNLYYGVTKQDDTVDTLSGADGFFNVKFPDDAYIIPGEYQTVSIDIAADFLAAYSQAPTYKLEGMDADSMLEAFSGSKVDVGDLAKTGDTVILYKWNSRHDKVFDCDYGIYGDGAFFVDKTGVSIDGIDADALESDYFDDTAGADQSLIASTLHNDGGSFNRCDEDEGFEEKSGLNNGLDPSDHDETSEDLEETWETLSPPTPNDAPDCDPVIDDDDDDDDDDDTGDDDDSGDDDDDDNGCCG